MKEQGRSFCGNGLKRFVQVVPIRCCLKKPSLRACFGLLSLIGLVSMVVYYAQPNYSLLWKERFFNWTLQKNHTPHQNQEIHVINLTMAVPTGPVIQYHIAYPRNYDFIIDDTEACKTESPFLVLMVPVAPKNLAARTAIRKTWGNETLVHGELVRTFFMLGLPGGTNIRLQQDKVKEESLLYHDLIQSDFMDSYLNLTVKTMVIMDWLATRCPSASYGMKIDSDMFLNVDNLVAMLKNPKIPEMNYLTGMLMWNRPVVRSKSSKWYVPFDMYPDALYPTYTLGMGYVFSNDLPGKFVNISKTIKPFNIEDAYIGMCMKKIGLAPTQSPNPSQFKAYNQAYNRCEFSKIITYILGSSQKLVQYWNDLKKPDPPCQT